MPNLVLYRKYRPKTFAEIIGQEHIIQTLTNAVSMGLISHAYLFSGPRGSGKTTIARIFAKAVNCQNRKDNAGEPCNQCSSCSEVNESRAIDLIEIDAASNRGIDEIRQLREGVRFVPAKSKYKVFIIDESHQLSKDAANALLKTLEEPPGHAIFVLATTEIQKMIPTIISRCQRFDFRKLTLPEIIKRLEIISRAEKVKFEKSALELIAVQAAGSLRDAEGMLDQTITFAGTLGRENQLKKDDIKNLLGLVDTCLANQLVDLILAGKKSEALKFVNDALEKGYDPQEFIKSLIRYFRQGLILKISLADSSPADTAAMNPIIIGLTNEEREKLTVQTAIFKEQDIRRVLKLFIEAENRMRYSSIPQLPLELAIIEAMQKPEKPENNPTQCGVI